MCITYMYMYICISLSIYICRRALQRFGSSETNNVYYKLGTSVSKCPAGFVPWKKQTTVEETLIIQHIVKSNVLTSRAGDV